MPPGITIADMLFFGGIFYAIIKVVIILKRQADVFINISVKTIAESYTYIIPEKFKFLKTGCRVVVSFGARKMEGFIVRIFSAEDDDKRPLKEIADIIDTEPYFTDKVMQTAHFISEFYLCSLGEALRLFIPGKNSIKLRSIYSVTDNYPAALTLSEHAVYEFIAANPDCDLNQIRSVAKDNTPEILKKLQSQKAIFQDYFCSRRAHLVYDTYVQINSDTVTESVLQNMTRKRTQKRLLEFLADGKIHSIAELTAHKFSRNILNLLAASNYILLTKKRAFRNSYNNINPEKSAPVLLTSDQQSALSQIIPFIQRQEPHTFLLYGVTGSGKTQLYIEAAKYALKTVRQSLILVPEIVLTGQLVVSLKNFFAENVVVIHSRLTVSERSDAFMRIRTNDAKIIIGARSAIFAPFFDLGLIVMDEEHDSSYKQDESPRYHTRDIAQKMSLLYNAALILGSATPSIESYFYAQKKIYTLLKMPHRIDNHPLPHIEYVDMREELHLGNRHILSRALSTLISKTLEKKQQIIIMLNRRGYSTFVMCRSCGLVIKCPQCGLPLVYHKGNYLQCHHCDIKEDVPDICPSCNSRYIKFFGSGTEKLEQELQESFPTARIIRLDRDTTGRKFAHQEILRNFKSGAYDILLGTQMVAKGHDIPSVTAVGIISADSSLNMPDFRSAERCFSLITQTAGRAGRGTLKGNVIVQGYNPEHYAVVSGIAQDYDAFYRQELILRKELFYPPYASLVKLTVQHENESTALQKALSLRESFKENFTDTRVHQLIGPAPSVIANFRGIYRFNILLKTADLACVNKFLCSIGLDTDKDVKIDVNPLNTM